MTATRTRTHLVAVTLRARSRKALIPARLSCMLNQVRAVGKRFATAPHTTVELDLLVRRRLLGDAAYQLAVVIETALEITGNPALEDHLNALNAIGVNHQATAQDLATEARTLARHAQDITRMANRCPRTAATLNTLLEKNR